MRIKLTEEQYALLNEYINGAKNISEEETRTLKIPKIDITKITAESGSVSRGEIEKFINTLKGEDIKTFFTNLTNEAEQPQTPEKMVSTLLLLDLLRKINEDFDRSAGGFMFEYLISPIIGGTGVPTKTDLTSKIKSSHPNFTEGLAMAMKDLTRRVEDISDVMSADGTIGYSIKNLAETTLSKGSIMNLLGSLYSYEDIKFFVAYRSKESGDISIYEVSLGNKDNPKKSLEGVNPGGFIKFLNGVKKIEEKSSEMSPEEISNKIKKLKEKYKSDSQFALLKSVLKTEANKVAEIPMSRINNIEKRIVDKLNDSIFNIYDDLDSLARNLNSFYTETEEAKKKQAGNEAVKDSNNLSCEVNATAGKGGECQR